MQSRITYDTQLKIALSLLLNYILIIYFREDQVSKHFFQNQSIASHWKQTTQTDQQLN